jgi:HK97 family phage major capsid protein
VRKSLELKHEKGVLVEQYRAELKKIEAAGRKAPNSEEKPVFEKMDADIEALDTAIAMHEKQETRESASNNSDRKPGNAAGDPGNSGAKKPVRNAVRGSAEFHVAFCAMLASGKMGDVSPEIRNALQADSDTSAGYLAASEQFSNDLIEIVDNDVFMRSVASIQKVTSAQSLGFPVRESDVDDADWTAELATGAESQLNIAKREFRPHPLAKRIKISKKLLRLSPNVADLVMRRLAYKFAVAQEKAFLLGDGVQKPLGVFTPSTNGISTGRDVLTGSATGYGTTADPLIDAFYTLKPQYMRNATWFLHRDSIRLIRKLKATTGDYIWQPGLTGGQPDRILDRPYVMSEFVPNTFTTGQYVGVVGDFSKYQIVDALDMEVQVLTELYAEQNLNGYIGRMETDGMPVLEEAFVRIKLS